MKDGVRQSLHSVPVKRRGNEAYHKYTWSKVQGNLMVMNGYPTVHEPTQDTIFHKSFNRKIEYCNTFFILLTYDQVRSIADTWNDTSADLNRFFTNLRNKLKRRGTDILYYIKANEAHESYYPHIHILIKLNTLVPCYRAYSRKLGRNKLWLFDDEIFNWKYGHTFIEGIDNEEKSIRYIMKYITGASNPQSDSPPRGGDKPTSGGTDKHTLKSLAMTWITKKRLYSTSMKCHLKELYPNFEKKLRDLPRPDDPDWVEAKCTINRLREEYYNNFSFPKINFQAPKLKNRGIRFLEREHMNAVSTVSLKLSLELKSLNNEGSWQVVAMRTVTPIQTAVFEIIPRKSLNVLENIEEKPPPWSPRVRETPATRPWKLAKASLQLEREIRFGLRENTAKPNPPPPINLVDPETIDSWVKRMVKDSQEREFLRNYIDEAIKDAIINAYNK